MEPEREPSICKLCQSSTLLPLLTKEGRETAAFTTPVDSVWISSFDLELFRRGQRFFRDNLFSCFVSHLVGLISLLSVSSVLRVLVMTGQSSTTRKAYDRYFNTLYHIKRWYETDSFSIGGRAYKSLEEVRRKHQSSQRAAEKRLSYVITQTDMVLTQWAFVGPVVLKHRKLGCKLSDLKELEGFLYFWKIIGYLIGIKDTFNLCEGPPEKVYAECHVIHHKLIQPFMKHPHPDYAAMATTLANGAAKLIPAINAEAFIGYTNDVMDTPFFHKRNKWQFTCYVWILQKGMQCSILGWWLRMVLNSLIRLAIWLKINLDSIFVYHNWLISSVTGYFDSIMMLKIINCSKSLHKSIKK